MLYTTYFNKINELPEETIKLIITRFTPNDFNELKYKNTYMCKNWTPSENNLFKYKKDKNWKEYVRTFKLQMNKYPAKIIL